MVSLRDDWNWLRPQIFLFPIFMMEAMDLNLKTLLAILIGAVVIGAVVLVVKTASVVNSAVNAVIAVAVIIALVIIVIWMFRYAKRK